VTGLPPHAPGMRIGLYGGSFNPPHAAHVLVSRMALRRLGLHRLWWLVSPGNPLKDNAGLPSTADRISRAHALLRDPRIVPTDAERRLGTIYTADTIRALKVRCPGVRFVWIMGSDSLATFQDWQNWRRIAAEVPFAVVDRPGTTHSSVRSRAAMALERYRLDESDARLLAGSTPPAWIYLYGPRSSLSSTALRRRVG
jgi:nicotinate-nucleotide adenylyltransferase